MNGHVISNELLICFDTVCEEEIIGRDVEIIFEFPLCSSLESFLVNHLLQVPFF